MTKEITKKEETAPSQLEIELDEIRKDYSNPNTFDSERNLIGEFNDLKKEKNPTEEQKNRKQKLVSEIVTMYGLENGIWVSNLGYQKDYATLARMRQKVIREYHCKSSLELMLADSIVASYWRIIKNERRLAQLLEKEDGSWSFDQLKVNTMKELNKEIDMASRRLNINIVLLKEMKQPALKVNVKTNTAFISENQQFNNNVENNESK
jgi:hypothetical protein